ncbi:MFS transporter [Microlunatus spumicola]|uniref:MFS transporter n=1 Tax=Microlunatus spumicola TaxID=81499 RepID=A0ABP6Y3G1_9ACTN
MHVTTSRPARGGNGAALSVPGSTTPRRDSRRATEPRRARPRPRDSGLWLFGYAHSLVGDQIFYVALTWAAVSMMSPARVGLVLVLGSVPRAVVLLAGGVLVDRAGPKRVIIVSDVLRTLVMVGAAVLLGVGLTGTVLIGVLAAVFGFVDGFFLPAVGAAPAFVTDPEGQTRLQALRTIVYRGAPMVGAPLASGLLVAYGTAAAFAVAAFLFAASVVALSLTRMTRPPGESPLGSSVEQGPAPSVFGEIRDGLRVIYSDRRLLVVVVVLAILDFGFAGPMTAGVPLLASEQGWGPGGIGWVLGGFGVGAVATAAVLAWRRPTVRAGVVAAVGLTLMSVGLLALGLVQMLGRSPMAEMALAGACGAFAGVGTGLFGTLVNASLIAMTPVRQLGRVMAAVSLSGYLGDPVSFSLTGVAAQGLGASSTFLFGGGLIMVAVIITWVSPAIRTLALPGTLRRS